MEKPTIHTIEPCFVWRCTDPAIDGTCKMHRNMDARDRALSPTIFEERRLRDRLQWVLEDYPELTACGLNVRKVWPKTEPDSPVSFEKFVEAYHWLKDFAVNGKGHRGYRGSYGVKHWCERLIHSYIPNGALIAAAYALGLKEKRGDGRMNTSFLLPPAPREYLLNE